MGEKRSESNKHRTAMREAKRSMKPSQIRARARRHPDKPLTAREQKALTYKPLELWDLEELAKGRPKNKSGNFSGVAPVWITRELHEKAVVMFKQRIRTDMQSHTIRAVDLLADLLIDEEVDHRGRPLVPASVKVDIAKFLIEHLIGKPTQPITGDVSVKLQGVLAAVLVTPQEMESAASSGQGYKPAASHRQIEEEIIDAEVVEDD